MPYARRSEIPQAVQDALPAKAQTIWMNVANAQMDRGLSEQASIASAWGALKNQGWEKDATTGKWKLVKKTNDGMVITGEIAKTDPEQRMVFGWANVAIDAEGNVIVDSQGDTIDPVELEKAAYDFVLNVRKAGEMHVRVDGIGTMVESVMLTLEKQQAMGIPEGTMPQGWWVGFKLNQEVFDKVKTGEYTMFSIGGRGKRSEVNA
jgi:cation transport regulator ChaB